MDIPVEILFTARRVRLRVLGVAEALHASDHPRTVLDAMREADDHGAVLLSCTDALVANGIEALPLIPECTRRGGVVQFVARAAKLRWRTLLIL